MRMYTSVLLIALSAPGGGTTLVPQPPTWLSDYRAAYEQGRAKQRPLAVFFGTGEEGWNGLSREGTLGKEASGLLRTQYVCLYVDLSKRPGKQLAAEFKVSEGPALVISDHNGEHIALRYAGTLAGGDLTRTLRKYADTGRVVQATDTDPNREVRNSPAAQPVRQTVPAFPYTQPAYAPAFGGFGERTCST
jgi:hypothetical protein